MNWRWLVFLVAFLAGITAYSFYQFVGAVREKYSVLSHLEKVRGQAEGLEKEKASLALNLQKSKEFQKTLSEEKAGLNRQLLETRAQAGRLQAALDEHMQESERAIDDLNAQISVVRVENKALLEEVGQLKSDLSRTAQEKSALEARTGSVGELKKMIRELRRAARAFRRPQPAPARGEKQKVSPAAIPLAGNKGYLIKDGRYVSPDRVKIEVQPLPN